MLVMERDYKTGVKKNITMDLNILIFIKTFFLNKI